MRRPEYRKVCSKKPDYRAKRAIIRFGAKMTHTSSLIATLHLLYHFLSFHRLDAGTSASIARTRSISLPVTCSSSLSTEPVAVWARIVSTSALILVQPFSASASRNRTASNSDSFASRAWHARLRAPFHVAGREIVASRSSSRLHMRE